MKNKKNRKKILILIIVVISVFGYFVYKNNLLYTPNYQRVSQILLYPEKEISFEIDLNKWEFKSGTDTFFTDESSGIALFYKNKKNIDWQLSSDNIYLISFEYTYDSTRQELCENGNTGDSCSPQNPYNYPDKDSIVINVDGYDLAIPVYLEDTQELSYPWVTQLVPEYNNQMLDRMNFLNRDSGVSDYNQDFRITIENPLDKDFWDKEIEPSIVHALKTFEVKDLSKQE